MPITVGSNIASLGALRQLGKSSENVSNAFNMLSSGMRITKASDDAAGLAIATNLRNDTRVFTQAIRNVSDGISLVTIASGALEQLRDIATRQIELAATAANGTFSFQQRRSLDREADALSKEWNRIVQSTTFNGVRILDLSNPTTSIQAGYGSEAALAVPVGAELSRTVGVGTFNTSNVSGININVGGTLLADFNSDGNLDLVATHRGTSSVNVALGTGTGSFTSVTTLVAGATNNGSFNEIVAADYNSDGIIDLAITSSTTNTIQIYRGNNNGTFRAAMTVSSFGLLGGYSLKGGDLNQDGKEDLVVGNGASGIQTLYGNGDGTFATGFSYASTSIGHVETLDINNDGRMDIVSSGNFADSFHVFMNQGSGTFSTAVVTLSINTYFTRISKGDFNGDGNDDLAMANYEGAQDNVVMFVSNGDGTFKAPVSIQTGTTSYDAKVDDFNNDGYDDVLANTITSGQQIIFSNGDGTFKAAVTVTSSGGGYSVATGDLNGDGLKDFVLGYNPGVTTYLSTSSTKSTLTQKFDLFSQATARESLTLVTSALQRVSSELGRIGASQARLGVALNNLSVAREAYSSALSRIMDVDIAEATSVLTQKSIAQKTGMAILAQANIQPQIALKLLQS
jgi:flagellin-like hook-associated protein FlgL